MNIRNPHRSLVAGLLVATSLSIGHAVAEGAQQHRTPAPAGSSASGRQDMYNMNADKLGPGSQELHRSHMNAMQEMQRVKLSGDVDQDFATLMKHHHEQGVKMAEIEARQGKNAEMKALAQRIVEAQKADIQKLDSWLDKQKKAQ